MDAKAYKLEEYTSDQGLPSIKIFDVGDLSPGGIDLKATLESGQCFRWRPSGQSGRPTADKNTGILKASANLSYDGVVRGRAVRVKDIGRRDLLIENANPQDFEDIWYDYFDLGTDYVPIAKKVNKDRFMSEAIDFAGGARILKQEFFETLISFIISANNNIPRIKSLIEELCLRLGDKIVLPESAAASFAQNFSFPDSQTVADGICLNMSKEENRPSCFLGKDCKVRFAGYRCPYIYKTSHMLASGEFEADYDFLAKTDQDSARKELCRLSGVGEKVADCILLYSGIRYDVCPIDTWVEKTIKKVYLDENAKKKDIRKFTKDYFGDLAGYAQLWFFYYARLMPEQLV